MGRGPASSSDSIHHIPGQAQAALPLLFVFGFPAPTLLFFLPPSLPRWKYASAPIPHLSLSLADWFGQIAGRRREGRARVTNLSLGIWI